MRLARFLNCSPQDVLALDGRLLAAAGDQMRAPVWTQTHELLATISDSLMALVYLYLKVNFKGSPKPPKPFPRPSDPPPKKMGWLEFAKQMQAGTI